MSDAVTEEIKVGENGAPAGVPNPAEQPVAVPIEQGVVTWVCPECGVTTDSEGKPFKNQLALDGHVRFKHTLPRAREAARLRGEELKPIGRPKGSTKAANGSGAPAESRQPPIAAPDFSDLDRERPPELIASAPAINYQKTAEMTFGISVGILVKIFGDEWKPSSQQEQDGVITAISDYFKSIELQDIPPGYMLAIVVAAYSAPRLAAPATKGKLSHAWGWVKSKFSRRKKSGFIPHIIVEEQ